MFWLDILFIFSLWRHVHIYMISLLCWFTSSLPLPEAYIKFRHRLPILLLHRSLQVGPHPLCEKSMATRQPIQMTLWAIHKSRNAFHPPSLWRVFWRPCVTIDSAVGDSPHPLLSYIIYGRSLITRYFGQVSYLALSVSAGIPHTIFQGSELCTINITSSFIDMVSYCDVVVMWQLLTARNFNIYSWVTPHGLSELLRSCVWIIIKETLFNALLLWHVYYNLDTLLLLWYQACANNSRKRQRLY